MQSKVSTPTNFEISLYSGVVPVDLALAPVESKIELAISTVPPTHEALKAPPAPAVVATNELSSANL